VKRIKGPRITAILLGAIVPVAVAIPLLTGDVHTHLKILRTGAPATRTLGPVPPEGAPQHFTGKVHFDILEKLLADNRRSASPDQWLRALTDAPAGTRVPTQEHELLNKPAPDFALLDHRGHAWALHDQLAHGPVVVVFYLGYSCNACVHHLFELNADLDRFRTLEAEIVAISGDEAEFTQLQFEKFGPFRYPVLCDPDHQVAQAFGVYRPLLAVEVEGLQHGTFLITRDERVAWVNRGDAPFRDNQTLLFELARLEGKLPRPVSLPAHDPTEAPNP
jgi:peroxiredoxin